MALYLLLKKTVFSVLILLLVFSGSCFGQNTKSFDPEIGSPKASLDDISWLAGHWRGEGMGGVIEEVWSAPLAGSMMGSFKFVENDKVKFYELELIIEENETLILRLKHFHANLMGWEEKDETVDFKLVKLTEAKAFFDNLTIEKLGENEMNIYVVVGGKDKQEEIKFQYKRVASK